MISNWQTYMGVVGLPEEKLAIGCLDGTLKVYKATEDEWIFLISLNHT